MEEALAKARKLGGSIIVTIPKDIVDEEGIRSGETIRIVVEKVKKSGFGAFKGIGPFTKEDEFDEHKW